MTKRQAERLLNLYGACALIGLNRANVDKLLRIEKTLNRWAALECGDSDNWSSWAIERDGDEPDSKPFLVRHLHGRNGGLDRTVRTPIPDRENGALRRLRAILEPLGLYYYHQSDPRGCALYVSDKPIPPFNYTQGIAVCID